MQLFFFFILQYNTILVYSICMEDLFLVEMIDEGVFIFFFLVRHSNINEFELVFLDCFRSH